MSNSTAWIKHSLKTESPGVIASNGIYKLLSFEEVKDTVKRVLKSDVDLVKYDIQPYSVGKLGFLGSHYRLNVVATRKEETMKFSLFLKTIPYDVPEQAEYVIKKGVFKQETMFYSVIMPLLCKGFCGELWAPTCYKVKENLLIFDELSDKGYSIRNKLFNKTLVRAGLSAIARLHAASLLAEARLGTPFNQLYPDVFMVEAFAREGMTREWFEAGIDVAATIAKRLGYDSNLVRIACEQVNYAMQPSCTKANVISHGDLWGNNFMFNNDIPPKCFLIDYQLLRYSPLAHDVAQFLYLCTDQSFRKIWETAMLQHYYKTLCETLNIHGIRTKKPSWSEIIEGMEEQRLGAVITAAIFFPIVLMDESLGAQVINNPASYSEYYFRSREKFVLSNMEKDTIYKKRINETVTELAELASRLNDLPRPS